MNDVERIGLDRSGDEISTRLHRMAAWVRGHESYTRRRIAEDLERLAGECGEQGEPTALSPTPAQFEAAEAAFAHVLKNYGGTPAPSLTLALRAAVWAAFRTHP